MEEMVMTGFKTKGLAEPIASFLIACLLAYGSLPGAAKAASDSSSTDSSTPAKAWREHFLQFEPGYLGS
jgi:hypothetical protein